MARCRKGTLRTLECIFVFVACMAKVVFFPLVSAPHLAGHAPFDPSDLAGEAGAQ